MGKYIKITMNECNKNKLFMIVSVNIQARNAGQTPLHNSLLFDYSGWGSLATLNFTVIQGFSNN